jgi:hypothetical protein
VVTILPLLKRGVGIHHGGLVRTAPLVHVHASEIKPFRLFAAAHPEGGDRDSVPGRTDQVPVRHGDLLHRHQHARQDRRVHPSTQVRRKGLFYSCGAISVLRMYVSMYIIMDVKVFVEDALLSMTVLCARFAGLPLDHLGRVHPDVRQSRTPRERRPRHRDPGMPPPVIWSAHSVHSTVPVGAADAGREVGCAVRQGYDLRRLGPAVLVLPP